LVAGGMQDYNYLKHGIFELTLEISCCKYPNASEIEYYWIENQWALINLLMEVHRGEILLCSCSKSWDHIVNYV
jgi:carboxypeptidase D